MKHPFIRRTESHLLGARGHSLLQRAWLSPDPELALLLIHGYGEHTGRYDHVGNWFAARGCAVHAHDQMGHGRSSGRRCHVARFDDFLDDLEVVLRGVEAEHPGLPVFLVGHSMGGLIVAAFACERDPDVVGVATSGAALALSAELRTGRILAARVLRRLVPRLSLHGGIDPTGLSRDPEVVRAYVEDPFVHDRMTFSLAAELLAAVARTAAAAAKVRVPMLLLHGEDDPLCPAQGSRDFHAQLTAPASELRTYPQLRHEIFNEPEREVVFSDLLEWLRARSSSPGD